MNSHRVMSAHVRFSNLLAPVLSEGPDPAGVAFLASEILASNKMRDVEVIPLSPQPELNEETLFAIRAGFADWHAVRLLIEQGKLPGDPRVPVRVHMNEAQWFKAGEVAYDAVVEHRLQRLYETEVKAGRKVRERVSSRRF